MTVPEEYVVVLSTTDSKDEAGSLAARAVTDGLAACVQAVPINSTYMWEGKVENSDELLLLFKTTRALSDELVRSIETHHSYDTPEIVVIPLSGGSSKYLEWITKVTR
jgi:periplasmic divalent cation tolerance protein